MAEAYKNIINNLRKGIIDQYELNSLENGFEQLFKRIQDLEIESYESNEQKAEMQSRIDCLKAELAESQMNKPELPEDPIKVAEMLICATYKRTNCMTGKEYDKAFYEPWKLKQIAGHLLVYYNYAEAE